MKKKVFDALEALEVLKKDLIDDVERMISPFCDNYYGEGYLYLLGGKVEIESVWQDSNEAINIHVCCSEFEGDVLFRSLSFRNQFLILDAVEGGCIRRLTL